MGTEGIDCCHVWLDWSSMYNAPLGTHGLLLAADALEMPDLCALSYLKALMLLLAPALSLHTEIPQARLSGCALQKRTVHNFLDVRHMSLPAFTAL